MRLRHLDGEFFGRVNAQVRSLHRQGNKIRGAQGVMFQCPKCAQGLPTGGNQYRRYVKGAHYVQICFANPIGAAVAPREFDKNPRWQMSGTSLDDLTLSPSINLDVPGNGDDSCKWHGWVRNGDAS